ncbi:hypothetical protein CRG98_021708 [Punica granatum]|uniref:Uncharacterized protein n=1 Tax=Punica granatum TaxID=22663 RepID=A0A2I0JPU8_PUNGR|nr:hypothetical protein CRG98_021708 [Punica granatum]
MLAERPLDLSQVVWWPPHLGQTSFHGFYIISFFVPIPFYRFLFNIVLLCIPRYHGDTSFVCVYLISCFDVTHVGSGSNRGEDTVIDPSWAMESLGDTLFEIRVMRTIASTQGLKGLSTILDRALLAREDPLWSSCHESFLIIKTIGD